MYWYKSCAHCSTVKRGQRLTTYPGYCVFHFLGSSCKLTILMRMQPISIELKNLELSRKYEHADCGRSAANRLLAGIAMQPHVVSLNYFVSTSLLQLIHTCLINSNALKFETNSLRNKTCSPEFKAETETPNATETPNIHTDLWPCRPLIN